MGAFVHTSTRVRVSAGIAIAGMALGVVSTPAHAAGTLPNPTIVGGDSKAISGTTVQVSFAPFAGLPAGTEPANRDTHIAVVSSAQACADLRFMYPLQSQSVPFNALGNTVIRDYAIPSKANDPQIETYFLCAWQQGIAPFGAAGTSSTKTLWRINANPAGAGTATPALPGTPTIVNGSTPNGVPVGGTVQVSAGLLAAPSRGDSLSLRQVRRSVVNSPNVGSCSAGASVQTWDLLSVGYGANDTLLNVGVPGGTVGKYLCLDQSVATVASALIRTSPPSVTLITGQNPSPLVNLQQAAAAVNSALSRVQNATRNLGALLGNPQANRQQVAEAIAEAQQAQEALQGAQAAAAQADPNAAANPAATEGVIANAPEQQQATAANEELRQQLQAALGNSTVAVSPTSNPTLVSLAEVTGFDPLTTPVVEERVSNAAGISLSVTKPARVKRGKNFAVTLNVAPTTTRGGMRQYLMRMNGDQPTLVHKRSGFITTGSRSKIYKISPKLPKGTYVLLSTFQPSVPGTPGLAITTPLTVR